MNSHYGSIHTKNKKKRMSSPGIKLGLQGYSWVERGNYVSCGGGERGKEGPYPKR